MSCVYARNALKCSENQFRHLLEVVTYSGRDMYKLLSAHHVKLMLFISHQVIREYFSSVLLLAEVLLRSSQPIIAHFASAIYRQAFIAFDAYCRQVGVNDYDIFHWQLFSIIIIAVTFVMNTNITRLAVCSVI